MGIGSTAYVALEQGRSALGFELKESYHAIAARNARKALENRQPTAVKLDLFSLAGVSVAAGGA